MSQLSNPQLVVQKTSSGVFGVVGQDANNFYCGYVNNGDNQVKIYQYSRSSANAQWPSGPPLISYPAAGSHSPALAFYNNKLTVVHREDDSGGDDKDLIFAQQDATKNGGWAGPYAISGMSGGTTDKDSNATKGKARGVTDHRPAICIIGNQLWVLDKDSKKHFITECIYNGTNWSSNSNQTMWQDGDAEDAQQHDWGYQINPPGTDNSKLDIRNQTLTVGGYNPQTPRNPSLTVLGTQMYLAYKGGVYAEDGSDETLYYMTSGGNYSWSDPVVLFPGFTSVYAPAITACNGCLVCVFSNHADHDYLYQSVYSGGAWSTPVRLVADAPHGSKGDPALATLSNNLVTLSYRNSDGKACLYTFDFN